jgi:Asp-tRNA(Asn)/Glu-tRNA(Gln) amidotransferase A subunit family amidase
MSRSRRAFLLSSAAAAVLGPAGAARAQQPAGSSPAPVPAQLPPDSPGTFASASPVGPEVSAATFAEAQKLLQVDLTPAECEQAAADWSRSMAAIRERRTGPRKVALPSSVVPYSICNPLLPGHAPVPQTGRFVRSNRDPGPLPAKEAAIALAPLWKIARWIEGRQLTSERLTHIYVSRIERFDPKLRAVITLTRDPALRQAQQADREIAAGGYRGPLHGVPWGAKDLLDTAGIATTYGAEPFRDRVPDADAAVVRRLNEAGAVLLAKLSLGALALNDVWFGGQTMNPWLPEEGSSGSSAGPGAATAAGLVGFAIGSETEGSIVSPSMRCGVTGLRPTFGRVPRSGAMTLCWSLDKLGPMARSVEDTMLVLKAISGSDPADLGSVPGQLDFDATAGVSGLRVGYIPAWMHDEAVGELDQQVIAQLGRLGLHTVEVALPDWPYDDLNTILLAEAAASFEELTLSRKGDQLRMQTLDAWPNTFRQARFLSAVDYVQADRLRRLVAQQMQQLFTKVDLLVVPSLRDETLTLFNFTGHPSLTLRTGFVHVGQARSDWAPDPSIVLPKFSPPRRVPHGVTLIGRLFDEGTIARVGLALEGTLKVVDEAPPGFAT